MRHFKITILLFLFPLQLILQGCGKSLMEKAQMQLERGEYFEAQKNYRKIYSKTKNNREIRAQAAFELGLCQLRMNQWQRAETAFRNSLRYNYPDSSAMLFLAISLRSQGKNQEAREWFESYLILDSTSFIARNGIESIDMVSLGHSRYKVKKVEPLNSRRSDFSPMIYPADKDIIYFTSTSELSTGKTRSEITGMKNADIWYARKDINGTWKRPQQVEGAVNTEHDEGTASFSPDGHTMYFSRATKRTDADTRTEIFSSQRIDGQWSTPVRFNFPDDSLHNYAHPAVSPDGKYLYFTSDRAGGYGDYDIWRIRLNESNDYIENLGSRINTPGNELFPFVRNDSTIYFSSDGHPGHGALDIFIATKSEKGVWTVSNPGSPINSPADDFGITFTDGENGYFSSNRDDVRGYDNIYSFSLPDLTLRISGYVMDTEEYSVPDATLRIIGNDGSNRRTMTTVDGYFEFPLEAGVDYIMQASAPEYLNAKQEFSTPNDDTDLLLSVDFILAPLNRPIIIENIFYDFDKATLRPESRSALDSLAAILYEYPRMNIELRSHTDRKGSVEYNNSLSRRRAMAVAEYLIKEKNIKPERLSYKGYGKAIPITITPRLAKLYPEFTEGFILTPEYIETLDEEERDIADQINRRTEFRITNPDFYLY